MPKRRPWIGCLIPIALLIAAVVGWTVWTDRTITLRYRLTIFVEDNGKVVSGSSVIETGWGGVGEDFPELANLHGGARWAPIEKAEAVAVNLGPRGILFAVFTPDPARMGDSRTPGSAGDPAAILVSAFGCNSIGGATWSLLYQIRDTRGPVDLPLQYLPWLVRFRDLDNPATVRPVDANGLAASFGPGVKLLRATVEITNDPVTTGIEKTLPWLALPPDARKKLLTGPYWNWLDPAYGSDHRLLVSYFKTGEASGP